jgi:DNA invertase Pin-like site-specific DNA recombinase
MQEQSSQKKRAAIYARVSTIPNQSPQMQLDVLREFSARCGYDVVGEYVDHGVSGAKERRKQLDSMMDAVRKRKVDVVLVYRFDRFARSVQHLVNALHEFDALGVQFVSYSENIDTGNPLGRALFVIASCLSELERNLIIERSREGVARAVARGSVLGRPKVKVDPHEVLHLRAQGLGLRTIGKRLGVSKHVVARVLADAGNGKRAG